MSKLYNVDDGNAHVQRIYRIRSEVKNKITQNICNKLQKNNKIYIKHEK